MKKLLTVLAALSAPFSSGAELKHPAASIELPGTWEKDKDSTDDELTLNSKPEGQQVIVSVLHLKKEEKNIEQLMGIAVRIYKMRLEAFLTLSNGTAKFDKPESDASDTSVVCWSRGYVEKDNVRMAVRVQGGVTSKIIRSTSVYDYSGMSAEDFRKWSDTILAGVK